MRISDWSSDVCSSDLYKANRKASRKPLCYWTIIDHLRAEGRYRVLSEDCLEGDDYIGILATRTSPMDSVIVSEDEDMQTLPNVKIWRQDNPVEATSESAENSGPCHTLLVDHPEGTRVWPGC